MRSMRECIICRSRFESNYPHKKTCSKECSKRLKAQTRSRWVQENKQYFLEYRKSYYYSKDIDKVKERTRIYRRSDSGRMKRRLQQQRRIQRDPIYRIKRALRKRLWEYKRRLGTISMSKTIGCDWPTFKQYIESKFYPNPVTGEPMTWENYGKNGWHIDHIVPLCSASSIEDLIRLNHYTNLQPLWAQDNITKSLTDINLNPKLSEITNNENGRQQ